MGIEWKDRLSVGVDEIDSQHKELFKKINDLFDACVQQKGKEEVGKVIRFLEDYVVVHFTAEEKLQAQYKYPEMEGHKLLHKKFLEDFTGFKDKFEKEGITIGFIPRMNRLLVDWLTNHISNVDQKFGEYIKSQNS